MEAAPSELIEKKLDKIVTIATKLQWTWMTILCLIVLTRNIVCVYNASYNYKIAAAQFSLFAFLSSVLVGRIYIYTGKKVEKCKQFSTDEKEARKHEYFGKFLWPYFFWIVCFGIFSWL